MRDIDEVQGFGAGHWVSRGYLGMQLVLAVWRERSLLSVDMMTEDTPKMPNLDRPDVAGFALTYDSGTLIAPHAHPAHQIIHAISGTMRVSAQEVLWFLPIGRALWIPVGVEHAIRCEGKVKMRTAYLSPLYSSVPVDMRVISVSPLMREMLVRLSEEEPEERLRLLMGELLLHEIGLGSLEPFCLPIPKDLRIAELASHLQSDPSSKTTISEWANRLGFSERNLIRRIRDETGMTFRELRRQTRIMVAIEKLTEGQPATAVALDIGFETPSAFIHAFRLVTGKTPRQFTADT